MQQEAASKTLTVYFCPLCDRSRPFLELDDRDQHLNRKHNKEWQEMGRYTKKILLPADS